MTGIAALPFDLLLETLLHLSSRSDFYNCIQVNAAFQEAAYYGLYKHIRLKGLRFFGDAGSQYITFPALNALQSRRYLLPYVERVTLDMEEGTFSLLQWKKPKPLEWINMLGEMPSIRSFSIFAPLEYHTSVPLSIAIALIPVLQTRTHLEELNLLFDVTFDHLRRFSKLQAIPRITLGRVSETTLQASPIKTWMSSCQAFGIFETSGLYDSAIDCVASYSSDLECLVLGRGYHIPRSDILQSISPLKRLTKLHLFYDNFISRNTVLLNMPISEFSGFPSLTELVIRHQGVANQADYSDMFAWIHLLTSNSPGLTHLSVISDDAKYIKCPAYLSAFLTTLPQLKLLNLPFIGFEKEQLEHLLVENRLLEVLSSCTLPGLEGFMVLSLPPGAPLNLRALYIRSKAGKKGFALISKRMERLYKGSGRNASCKVQPMSDGWQGVWTVDSVHREGMDVLMDEDKEDNPFSWRPALHPLDWRV